MPPWIHRAFVVALVASTAACASSASKGTAPPETVVRTWLEALDEAPASAAAKVKAVALLAAPARQNLEERSKRTNVLLGRRTEATDMLAVGMTGLQFRPKHFRSESVASEPSSPDRVSVIVTGNEGERAVFACVRESEGWRIDISLPPLPQLQRR